MIAETQILMKYLPPSLGVFMVVVAAGLMGLFRSMTLSKSAYDGTVESLQRQIKVLEDELKAQESRNKLLEEKINKE
jgi:cell division protein FtsB